METPEPYNEQQPQIRPRPSTIQNYVMDLLTLYRRFARRLQCNWKEANEILADIQKLEYQQGREICEQFEKQWKAESIQNDCHLVQTISGPVWLSQEQFKQIHDEYLERFARAALDGKGEDKP